MIFTSMNKAINKTSSNNKQIYESSAIKVTLLALLLAFAILIAILTILQKYKIIKEGVSSNFIIGLSIPLTFGLLCIFVPTYINLVMYKGTKTKSNIPNIEKENQDKKAILLQSSSNKQMYEPSAIKVAFLALLLAFTIVIAILAILQKDKIIKEGVSNDSIIGLSMPLTFGLLCIFIAACINLIMYKGTKNKANIPNIERENQDEKAKTDVLFKSYCDTDTSPSNYELCNISSNRTTIASNTSNSDLVHNTTPNNTKYAPHNTPSCDENIELPKKIVFYHSPLLLQF